MAAPCEAGANMSPIRSAPADLTDHDVNLRARYLGEVLALLYPGAHVAGIGSEIGSAEIGSEGEPGSDVLARFLVVPDARKPRLLVPAGDRKLAAAAISRYAEATSRMAELKRRVAITALRSGASRVLLRDTATITVPERRTADSIDAYLEKVLGGSLAFSVHIGPARANRKPVLQLLSTTGETVGFVKLGVGPLTRDLVRAETAALGALNQGAFQALTVPRVLHAGQWREHEVLVQSALPIWEPRSTLTTKKLVAAMTEVARCKGVHTSSLAADDYWRRLRKRLEDLTARPAGVARDDGTDANDEARALANAADQLVAGAGHVELAFGAWHGDWTPWNMATTSSTVLVWDWERFTTGVPMGYDALHFDFQRLLTRGVEAATAVDITTSRASRLLAPFDVEPAAADVSALLYLIDLATRYLEDRQAEAGARLGVLGRWLLPVLTRKVTDLPNMTDI